MVSDGVSEKGRLKPVHRSFIHNFQQLKTEPSKVKRNNGGWDEMASNGIASDPPQSALAFNAPLEGATNGKEIGPIIFPLLCRLYLASNILQFDVEPRFSALLFLHRFATAIEDDLAKYKSISDWKWVGAACLFLACKAAEEPRRLRDVINLAEMLFVDEDEDDDNWVTMDKNPPGLNEKYWEAKKKVVETEQFVLRWMMFDISVAQPHRAVVLLLEKETIQRELLIPIAFRCLNDALFHTPSLTFPIMELAVAAIELAEEEVIAQSVFGAKTLNLQQRYNLSRDAVSSAKSELNEAANILRQCKESARFLKP
ncbi:unnamed protein product [Cylindrotheca closterium]|uniref:Cyclin N-terminal domain-containing protein n=1 Tax=Cylindrotheca closterium TaxID=2856 RepID=A0AAD2CQ09_9STRA|nr:unnamed protein product [Cylindrotheca closterium]